MLISTELLAVGGKERQIPQSDPSKAESKQVALRDNDPIVLLVPEIFDVYFLPHKAI